MNKTVDHATDCTWSAFAESARRTLLLGAPVHDGLKQMDLFGIVFAVSKQTPTHMNSLSHRISNLRARITAAASRSQRLPTAVTLLAVSKTVAADEVVAAYVAGQGDFAENYLQEAIDKMAAVDALLATRSGESEVVLARPNWHFIGPIQRNKTRLIAEQFAWVHSVDRLVVAERLSQQRPPSMSPLNVCLQVNLSGEAQKSGCAANEVFALAAAIAPLPQLTLRGLMTIPAASATLDEQRHDYRRLSTLLAQLNAMGYGLDTLSMGMSADFEVAITEGATIVRIGTALFGERPRRLSGG